MIEILSLELLKIMAAAVLIQELFMEKYFEMILVQEQEQLT
jgi:hypothetical protein